MNYISQINTFYKFLPNNPLSPNAQCLYFFLLNYNNVLCWKKEFTVANTLICAYTNLSRQALDRARNELIQKGYIQYDKGHSNKAGRYLIVNFDTQSDTQNDTQNDTQSDTQNDTQSGHTLRTLIKQNKTKQNKKSKEKVFTPPTLEEVASYISEKNLNVDAKRFMDYYEASDWTDKNGDKVKNWKLKVQTWASHSPPKDSGEIFKPVTLDDYAPKPGEDY